MKSRNLLISVIVMISVLIAACSSSTATDVAVEESKTIETNEAETGKENKGQGSGDSAEFEGQQTIAYYDLKMNIPQGWTTEKTENDSLFIYRSHDDNVYCFADVYNIEDGFVSKDATEEEVFNALSETIHNDLDEVEQENKGYFAGCPAVFHSGYFMSDDTTNYEKGVYFVADRKLYMYSAVSLDGTGESDVFKTGEKIMDTISISPSVNVDAYKANDTNQKEVAEKNTDQSKLTVEKEIVYDDHDVVISVDSIEEGNQSTIMQFVVENNSDIDYAIEAHAGDINGFMLSDWRNGFGYSKLPAGKKTRLDIEIENSSLKEHGIDCISEIDILFWAYSDSFKSWDTGLINIKTSRYEESYRAHINRDPEYSDEVVDVWYAGKSAEGYSFYVLNKSDYNADCTIENCSINGWAYNITDYTYDVYDEVVNRNAFIKLTLPVDSEFMSINDIDEIEDIEFDVHIEDNNWDTGELWEYSTDKITFSNF